MSSRSDSGPEQKASHQISPHDSSRVYLTSEKHDLVWYLKSWKQDNKIIWGFLVAVSLFFGWQLPDAKDLTNGVEFSIPVRVTNFSDIGIVEEPTPVEPVKVDVVLPGVKVTKE